MLSDQEEYLYIGIQIIDRTIRWLSPVFILLPVVLVLRAIHSGGMLLSLVQCALVITVWAVGFSGKRTTPLFRLTVYISALIFIGAAGMIRWGLMGTGLIPIILSILLSSMLGKKTWLVVSGIVLTLVAGVAVFWCLRSASLPYDPVSMMHSPVTWGITYVALLLTAAASFIWEGIHQRLTASITQLHESERKYRAIINSSSDAILIQDIQGRLLDVNKAACDMFGFDHQSTSQHSLKDFISGETPYSQNEISEIMELVLNDVPQIFERKCVRLSGDFFWAEFVLRHAVIEGQSRLVASVRDISLRKNAEEEHGKLEAKLRQSQKMEAVGRLAGGVAHDFNNMLGVILGHTDMALDDIKKDKPVTESLREIKTAAERSANLTRQLLVFARKQTIAPKVLDLNQTVEGMLTILRRLIGENIDLLWVPNPDLWRVKIDPTQVDQILTNLCVNARDAIKKVGKLTIETQNITLDEFYCNDHVGFIPGEFILLAVSDNGSGMDRHTLENLFEPFFTTKGVAHGSGLGLATLYGIVKQNQGFINVYSELGMGTTFKIYLPRIINEPLSLPKKKMDHPENGGDETILLVEDEKSILKMTSMMLMQKGYTVITSPKPSQAVRIASAYDGNIDLVITDVVMPEMNGRDLLKNVQVFFPDVKSLFMSGYTANVIAHHGVLDEGVNFIQKPFSKKGLLNKVRAVIDNVSPDSAQPLAGKTKEAY